MQNIKLKKRMQRVIALGAITSFLMMPVNMACANNITAGDSTLGGMTHINNGTGNITDITSGFVQNGTGMNHFNNFDISSGGVANMIGADRYINMVNKGVNINGTLNAFTNGQLPANVMFISPEGMAVGAGGILNVAGLQMITPTQGDYNSLVSKAGLSGAAVSLTEADFANLKAGGDALIQIGGKIYSTADVVLSAGNGIYFLDGGIIDTTAAGEGLGNVSLFTNTGDIVGSLDNAVNIDANGNIVLSAKNGGIGTSIIADPSIYGEDRTVTPLNVKIKEGKKLDLEVSDELATDGSFKGYASVANNTTNLKVGSLKGANVKVTNKGYGTLSTTEDITDVGKIYLNAEKGALNVDNNITAKEIVRLNGNMGIDATGNLTVTDNGYISVYSENGGIDMNDATLKMGNIDIKAKGGDVSHGNLTIAERGPAEGTLRLVDNKELSTGIKAPDTFRFDGIHVTSENGNVAQKAGTKISSAGRVDLTAGGNVSSEVSAFDLISVTAGGDAKLATHETARLGDVSAKKIEVTGDDILVDGRVKGSSVDINATDKLTIRPDYALDADHKTYGAIESVGAVNITTENGIFSTAPQRAGATISSSNGGVNLNTKGDIAVISTDGSSVSDPRITVDAANNVNANGNNVNIFLANSNGNVGLIEAVADANIGAAGKLAINEKITAGNDVVIDAVGNIIQNVSGTSIESGNDMSLTSSGANVGLQDGYLTVKVGGLLDAAAPNGGVYINGVDDLNVNSATAGQDISLKTPGTLTVLSANAGGNLTMAADKDANVSKAEAGKDITVNAKGTAAIANAKAGNDATVNANVIKSGAVGANPAVSAGNNVKLTANAGDIGAIDKHFTVKAGGKIDAAATTEGANVYLGTIDTAHVGVVEAANDVSIQQSGDVIIDEIVKAGNNVKIAGEGAILQADNTQVRPAIKAGNDISLSSMSKDVGAADNYLTISLGGALDAAAPNGGVYIEGLEDLNVTSATAGKDIALKTPGMLTIANANAGENLKLDAAKDANIVKATAGKDADVKAGGNVQVGDVIEAGGNLAIAADGYIHQTTDGKVSFKSGNDMSLTSAKDNVGDPNKYLQVSVGGALDAVAENGGVYIGTPDNLTIGKVVAGQDAIIIGDGYIHQTVSGTKPAITTGKDLTLVSNGSDVGDPNNYLSVKVGGALDATAPKGGVYIEGLGNLNVDKVEAGTNVGLKADGYIHQTSKADPSNPTIIAGKDMNLESAKSDVGDPDNYLQVKVGGVLDANAPQGGVYIGSKDNITVGKINAGKDVGIETDGYIHQTGTSRPAITAGEDLHLVSNNDNVGDPDHYLTVSVGDKLDAHAPNGGVYIEGYGDLTVDRIEAGEDVGIRGNEDIIIPHDKEDGNIISGGDVKIEAGDSVLNGGGDNVGIVSDGDIDITANLNEKDPAGSIGELPYNDLNHSINVIVKGDVIADEVGVPEADKILNIHIMGQVDPNTPDGGDTNYEWDDRDQRNMKFLSDDDKGNASVRNHRQDLRYNVAASEYVLLNSDSESGAKVQDVLNISKQGMLVKTTELPSVGENIQITMDYKGLPFTVEGQVVRTDAAHGTAGVKFNAIDQFTSSMILYLGMMNGR